MTFPESWYRAYKMDKNMTPSQGAVEQYALMVITFVVWFMRHLFKQAHLATLAKRQHSMEPNLFLKPKTPNESYARIDMPPQ